MFNWNAHVGICIAWHWYNFDRRGQDSVEYNYVIDRIKESLFSCDESIAVDSVEHRYYMIRRLSYWGWTYNV